MVLAEVRAGRKSLANRIRGTKSLRRSPGPRPQPPERSGELVAMLKTFYMLTAFSSLGVALQALLNDLVQFH
jgi:hypothetical protein